MRYIIFTILFLIIFNQKNLYAQSEGNYRSVNHGGWNTQEGIWEVFRNGKWEGSGPPPLNANISIESNITCSGQVISGSLTISGYNNLYGNLEISNVGTFSTYGNPGINGTIINNGTINLHGVFKIDKLENNSTGTVNIFNSAGTGSASVYIYNYGKINTLAFDNIIGIVGEIKNYGTFQTSGAFETNLQASLENYNTTIVEESVLRVGPGQILNKGGGNVTVRKGAKIIAGPYGLGSMTLEDNSYLQGEGIIEITGILQINGLDYTFPSSLDLYLLGGGIIGGSGNLKIEGNLYWNGGRVGLPLTVLNSGKVFLNSATVGDNQITNYGTFIWNSGDIYIRDYPFVNYGTFEILTGGRYGISSSYFNTYFDNYGTLIKKDGSLSTLDMLFQNKVGGKISGSGSLSIYNLYNDGTISPGQSPGELEITSQYGILSNNGHSGILEIEIENKNNVIDFDKLVLKGNTTLGGILKVTTSNVIPNGNYTIISGDSKLLSSFSEIQIPEGFSGIYNDYNFILEKNSTDTDNDGIPDEEDCAPTDATKWQSKSLYIDADGDGYDAGQETVCYGATIPEGYSETSAGEDCDPADAAKWQSAMLYRDMDSDNFSAGQEQVCYGASIPLGYNTTSLGPDCDDYDPHVHSEQTYYADYDGDGYGDPNNSQSVCSALPPMYHVSNNLDCDDGDINTFPGADEIADGKDNNCNGEIDEGVVPVQLIYFNGTIRNQEVILKWESRLEENLKQYDVEKRTERHTFYSIATVQAKGSNSHYSTSLQQQEKVAYYRLRMTDIDGKVSYSRIVALRSDMDEPFVIAYPNPARNELYVKLIRKAEVLISNAVGAVVKRVQLEAGVNRIRLSELSSGTYFLVTEQHRIKFIKQ